MFMKRNKILTAIGITVLSVVVLMTVAMCGLFIGIELQNQYTLDITLNQQRVMTVEFGESYKDPGAVATFFGTHRQREPKAVEVVCRNTVDTGKLGTQLIKYTAEYGGYLVTAYRRVTVVDTTPPEITLQTNAGSYTLPGQTYQEEGYAAIDNHDGDITGKVIRKQDKDKVVYTVSDLSGNTTTKERPILYRDPTPPVLVLNGSSIITLQVGQSYEEKGYLASDNCDGDLTGKVKVSGTVDTQKPGVYSLTYSVSDRGGNKTSVTRKVVVVSPGGNSSQTVIPQGKVIYLTFDDGPSKYTPQLLDVLKRYNVKATFFVVNKPAYNSYIGRAYREGHSVAIHTKTHVFKEVYASPDAYFADMYAMQKIIKEQTGVETTLLRFPGGSSNTVSKKYCPGIMSFLTREVEAQGFRYFDWNVDSNDAGGATSSDQVYRNVISGVSKKNYSVVLQHDTKGFSVAAVERIIVWGLENGYTFLPLNTSSPTCHHNIKN